MNNNMLWMHNEARQARPSAVTMHGLLARYPKGVRFRVHQNVARQQSGVRTFFKPVIEVIGEIKGRLQWVTFLWLDHEEVSDEV